MPFHFLPGDLDKIPEIRGRKNPYSTTPGSKNAKTILEKALGNGDPYRIGVALHTFVDSWSHQNFTGYKDEWNAVNDNIIPNVGHAEVIKNPDIISKEWTDSRLKQGEQKINNAQRAKEAVKEVFKCLFENRNPNDPLTPEWNKVEPEIDELINAGSKKKRIKMAKEKVRAICDKDIEYRKTGEGTWIYDALEFDRDTREVIAKEGFKNSHWYKFQLAAKSQLSTVVNMVEDMKW
jgi:hypothetical protein